MISNQNIIRKIDNLIQNGHEVQCTTDNSIFWIDKIRATQTTGGTYHLQIDRGYFAESPELKEVYEKLKESYYTQIYEKADCYINSINSIK